MKVGFNSSQNVSFGLINRTFLKRAQGDFSNQMNVSVCWIHQFGDDIFLFRHTSIKDGKDTFKAAEKYMPKSNIPAIKRGFKDLFSNSKQ